MRRRCAKEPPWRIDLRLMRLVYAENSGRTLEKMFAGCDQFASDQGGYNGGLFLEIMRSVTLVSFSLSTWRFLDRLDAKAP